MEVPVMRVNGWSVAVGLVVAGFTTWAMAQATTTAGSLLSPAQAAAVHGGLPASSSTAPKCDRKQLTLSCQVTGSCAESIDHTTKCDGKCPGDKEQMCSQKTNWFHSYASDAKKWKKNDDRVNYFCGKQCDTTKNAYTCTLNTAKDGCICKGPDCVELEKPCNRWEDGMDPCS